MVFKGRLSPDPILNDDMKRLKTPNISRFIQLLRNPVCGLYLMALLSFSGLTTAQQVGTQTPVTAATATAQADSPALEQDNSSAAPAILISELAATSDLVAIAKVEFTNYKYRRGFPVDGYADLSILIAYKSAAEADRIRVRDSGLHSNQCYFPTTFPGQDGARFLVFLSRHPDGDFRGNPLTCKLSVLVTDKHRYALRYPLDEQVKLSAEQSSWVTELNFNDPNAFAGSPEMTPGRKAALAAQLDGIVDARGVKYTKGLPIRYFTRLIGTANLQRPSGEGRY